MKIGEIIDRLNKRESLMMIARQLGLMPHVLSKKLRALGYEYDSEKKKRVFVGEGEEPRDKSIWGDLPQTPSVDPVQDYQKLMYEELCHIRLALEKQEEIIPVIEESERLRRSFLLSASLLSRLDELANKRGMQKSRLVEEALRLLLEKYR